MTLTVVCEGGEGFESDVGRLGGIAPRSGQRGVFFGGIERLGGVLVWDFRGLEGGFEVAVDADIDVLIETGIGFEAGFGGLVGLENTEIMLEEADSPFKGFAGGIMFEGMGTTLGEFDNLTVCYAGLGPGLWEVVSIELKHAGTMGTMADNDVFAAFLAGFEVIHGAPEGFIEFAGHKVAHSLGMNGGVRRKLDESRKRAFQIVNYRCF